MEKRMTYEGEERRSEISQAIRRSIKCALDEHEVEEQAWLAEHEKKDISAHEKVCETLDTIIANQAATDTLIKSVTSVWDGAGAIGRGIFWTAKLVLSIGVILGSVSAVVHFWPTKP